MLKKVGKRNWSLDKFSEAVRNACEKKGIKFSANKCKQSYENLHSVYFAVENMTRGGADAPAPKKKVAAVKPAPKKKRAKVDADVREAA